MLTVLTIAFYIAFSLVLLPYGYNTLVLMFGATRYKPYEHETLEEYPLVTVQLPVYNDVNVVERLVDSICALDWPINRLEVQVLDDSDDETVELVNKKAKYYRAIGYDIKVLRRTDRTGYKAGALQYGLSEARGDFIALFDADFVPPVDFLLKTVPHLVDSPSLGFVQTRWGYLNRLQNPLTKAVALSLDFYHLIDQSGRQALGCFTGFNGSAGVFRTSALNDVVGWSWDTLSEDMDMSFKLQLKRWKGRYIRDVVVEGELPPTMSAYRVQQARWSKGSVQCALKHIPSVWGSNLSMFQKIQASLQLTSYTISLLMFMTFILAVSVSTLGYIALPETHGIGFFTSIVSIPLVSTFLTVGTLCIALYYLTPIWKLDLPLLDDLTSIAALVVLGYGISAICAVSLVEGLFVKGGEFMRVPKNGNQVQYSTPRLFTSLEPTSMALCFLGIGFASVLHALTLLTTLLMYGMGFLAVGYEGFTPIWLLNALRNVPPSNP